MISDRELVMRLQGGYLNALGELYDRHRHMVFRTALAITGDPSAASDLLQDVFLRVHRFSNRIDPDRPLEPWLYRITINLTYTWVKRHKRLLSPLEDITEWLSGGTKHNPSVITEKYEEWEEIRLAITRLPINQRVVVVLYYISDLSLQEISDIVDIPEGTVKSRLYYGRQAIRKQLETTGVNFKDLQYEFT